jgi:hypothetical protein
MDETFAAIDLLLGKGVLLEEEAADLRERVTRDRLEAASSDLTANEIDEIARRARW